MTTMAQENKKMTLGELILLENRINNKQETIEDYRTIDSFLSSSGLPDNYFMSVLNKENIFELETLYQFRKNPPEPKDPVREGRIRGTLIGLITFLKNQL
jgi:hypothetical protein